MIALSSIDHRRAVISSIDWTSLKDLSPAAEGDMP
jgi:hypothetical protein